MEPTRTARLRALMDEAYVALEAFLPEPATGGEAFSRDRRVQSTLGGLLEDPEAQDAVLGAEGDGRFEPLLRRLTPGLPLGSGEHGEGGEATCIRPELSDRVERYFDGALAPSEEPALWSHLEGCAACLHRYGELWQDESRVPDGPTRRRRRLMRGLPWSVVLSEERDENGDSEIPSEPVAVGIAVPGSRCAEDPEPDLDPDPDPEPVQEPALSAKGRYSGVIALVIAGLLAVLGAALLLGTEEPGTEEPARPGPPPEVETPPTLDPDRGLGLAILRFDDSEAVEEPWVLAIGSVAAGERIIVTYHIEEDRGPFLAVVLLDDQGGLRWLLPDGGPERGFEVSAKVVVPAQAARLQATVEVPRAARRLVLYAVASNEPLTLKVIGDVVTHAAEKSDFFARPPRLDLQGSTQFAMALDVVP